MMTFGNANLQSIVEHYQWAGRVPATTGCTGVDAQICFVAPLTVIEANIGINKVNPLISRTLTRHLTMNPDGTRNETATMTIRNPGSGQQNAAPYRTYLRFLLPAHSAVSAVRLDNATVPTRTGTKLPPLPYAETASVASGAYTLGVAIDIPPGKEVSLTLTFTVSVPLSFGPDGAVLDVYTPKQPGVDDTPLTTTIGYPTSWTAGVDQEAGQTREDFIAKPGQLEYNTILTRDQFTRIRFSK